MPITPTPLLVLTLAVAAAAPSLAAETTCQARSGPQVNRVLELYTSEGCNSCPPADRWLSRVKADAGTVVLAFHVDYWDRLGWKDRFASPAYTERQALQQAVNGARFSYTPQVVLDGLDRKDWFDQTPPDGPAPATASVALSLQRNGDSFSASVLPLAAAPGTRPAPTRLAAYWAITEQGHVSDVKAGENQGVMLRHDFVVRAYQPVAAWAAQVGSPVTLSYRAPLAADPAHPRQVNLVVVDAAGGRPVQALKLGC